MNALKDLVIWLVTIVVIAMFFDLHGDKLNNNFISTFLPHKGRVQGNGSIEFTKSRNGHFYIQAQINNRNVTFLLDTGATDIVLSKRDAEYVGINLKNIENFKKYETAKGTLDAGVIKIPRMRIGNFVISDIQASVNSHSMSYSLLGMSFLKYFDFIMKDNKLILYRDKR
ncbi:MAG: TIGR02281 family clan AA aspartic protease [Wolbachia endosymbiont of Tyrophagus putrescentiae]|nr:TIGR02281 family clan AA aspartic protease [Wolbachia endosymbiont of Tyrophagus putrescentiae]MDN5249153.1 TIGR02281 family clan AA aspartic protease [Alphaproteobacteria bacterium]